MEIEQGCQHEIAARNPGVWECQRRRFKLNRAIKQHINIEPTWSPTTLATAAQGKFNGKADFEQLQRGMPGMDLHGGVQERRLIQLAPWTRVKQA